MSDPPAFSPDEVRARTEDLGVNLHSLIPNGASAIELVTAR